MVPNPVKKVQSPSLLYHVPPMFNFNAFKKQILNHKNHNLQPLKKDPQTQSQRKTQSSSRLVEEKKSKLDKGQQEAEKIQHICVVNGSVVTFKNFGFENFTNWFGDESVLE